MNDTFPSITPPGRRRTPLVIAVLAGAVVLAAMLIWRQSRVTDSGAATTHKQEASGEGADRTALRIDKEAQERIGLETVDVQQRPLSTVLRITGVVTPDDTRVAHIRPLAPGVITNVLVRRGDQVTSGQALLAYDNAELAEAVAAYRGAQAALEGARGGAEVARLALERADRLVQIGGIAQADQQRRRAEYATAAAAVTSSEAQLASLRQTLARFGVSQEAVRTALSDQPARSTLRTPFGGTVLDVRAVAGETVSAERELATIADLKSVWILGDVYERDLAAVRVGGRARAVTDAYPDSPIDCRVTFVSPELDPQTRTAKVRCEAPNTEGRLRLQMFARLELPGSDTRRGLAVPRDAIQQVDGEATVFVRTAAETFEPRKVALGVTASDWVEITSGAKAGDQVVTTGAVMLKSRLKASELAEPEKDESH